jgi:hypothetical protein
VHPAGEAIPISILLYVLIFTQRLRSTHLRIATLGFLLVMCTQFAADYAFIRTITGKTYVNGGFVDLLYMFSYFSAAIAILTVSIVRRIALDQNQQKVYY